MFTLQPGHQWLILDLLNSDWKLSQTCRDDLQQWFLGVKSEVSNFITASAVFASPLEEALQTVVIGLPVGFPLTA